MKTGNKTSSCKDNQTAKFSHASLKRIRQILRLNDTVACPDSQFILTAKLAKLNQTPEAVVYQIENERRTAVAGMYANPSLR
jgi:hypothetical protein